MLSVFPQLLDFALVAPFLLRITAGIYFMAMGYQGLRHRRNAEKVPWPTGWKSIIWSIGSLVVLVSGLFLFRGVWTQIDAIILALTALIAIIWSKKYPAFFSHNRSFYLLLFVITLSLLVSGPGLFALDFPL